MGAFQIKHEGDVATLWLDDGKANTLLEPQFHSLLAALDELEKNESRCIVLTGRPGFLSAGLDVKRLPALPLDEKRRVLEAMGQAMLKLFLFPKPVVAAVSGHALGAGAMLALASDIRVFADGPYRFGLNEVPAGLFVPSFAIELARAAISASRLTELVLHGRVVSPQEALSMHVAETLHAPESLMAAAMMHARALSNLAGQGYAITKRHLRGEAAERARASLPTELELLAGMVG